MNADAVAVLRLLTCCHGHVGTVVAAWGDRHADMLLLRLETKGYVRKRREGACRRGYYEPTAAGFSLLDHDNRLGFEHLADEHEHQEPHHAQA